MIPAPPFDWAQYLVLATELSGKPDEASHRSSISRAYYSIFHAATIRAKGNGWTERGHTKLWALYQRDPDRECRRLSTLGNQMRAAREDADYTAMVHDVPGTVTQQLADGRNFIAALDLLPAASPAP